MRKMLTHSKETQREKSQSQDNLFLGKLVFSFNHGISIHGGSLDHHTNTTFMKFSALFMIEFDKKK